MKNSAVSVQVGILFFEKVEQTIECVESFLPSNVPLFVCNNGSSHESIDRLRRFTKNHPTINVIDAGSNRGVSGGRNILINHSTADWIFFVDNDITVETSDWLDRMRKHLEHRPNAEVLIPELYNVFERTFTPHRNIEIDNHTLSFQRRASGDRRNLFPGGASIVRRSLFERLGPYDEKLFVNFEDYELCVRGVLSRQPARAFLANDIRLRHDHRRVQGSSDREYVSVRYDADRARSSAKRILEKHGLRVQNDAVAWSAAQADNLLHGRHRLSTDTLRSLIPASIKRWWNNRR